MPVTNYDQVIKRLIQEVNDIRVALGSSVANFPLYDIANENTPATITVSQNNYAPGNFDVLRLNATGNISITGISGGKKGRFLEIINVSAFKITLPHESLLSSAANRFTVVGGENIVLFPTARVRLYYDFALQRWQIPDRPAWLGTYGKSVIIPTTYGAVSLPDDTTTKITGLTTVTSDEWGMWSVANQRITIPETGLYMGTVCVQFPGNLGGPGDVRAVSWQKSGFGTVGIIQVPPCALPIATDITVPVFYKFDAGDIVEIYALQDHGGAMTVDVLEFAFTRIT